MPPEIDLTDDEDAALDRVWDKYAKKLANILPSKHDDGDEPAANDSADDADPKDTP